jgi:phosphatidylglycerol:prolipoprotein diacylglycerol transferase
MISFPNLGIEFAIERTAFTLFGLAVYWYGVVVTAAVLLGFHYATKRAPQFGMISHKVFDAAFCGLFGGIIGARLYYVLFYNLNPANADKYTFIGIFTRFRGGGLATYGGFIGAILLGLVFMKLTKMKLAPVLDLAGLGFLLGIAVGRWGNFFNQEAYGSATTLPWGMSGSTIAADVGEGVLVHPCFLYESLWCLLGFILLHLYSKKLRTFDGEVFLLFVAWYGLGRAFIEHLRSDSLMLGDFKISQLLACVSAGAAIGAFVYFKRRKANRLYRDTPESAVEIAEYERALRLNKEKAAARKALKEKEAPSILGDDEPAGNDDEE